MAHSYDLPQHEAVVAEGFECPHTKIAPTSISFDPKGDLFLLVGRQKCYQDPCVSLENHQHLYSNAMYFQVNSERLLGASPALRFTLRAAKKASEKWVVKFPDDDSYSMLTIIYILYGHTTSPPFTQTMNIEQLLSLTILANKYDLTHLLKNWSVKWVKDMEPYWFGEKFIGKPTEHLEALLWIFWVLGHEPFYTHMMLQLAAYSGLDAGGRLADPAGSLCFINAYDLPVPPLAPIDIAHIRNGMLKFIRKSIKETLEEHLYGSCNKSWVRCCRMDGRDDLPWRRSVLRSFVGMLQAEGLWPLPSAYDMTASPKFLVERFRRHPNLAAFTHHRNGRYCHPDGTFWERIEKIIREVRITLPAQASNHLKEQAMKSGLADHFESMGLTADRVNWNMEETLEFQADCCGT
ncbi:hypothetical protein F5Y19DRAFT_324670 [Xylariaceae sp. FL1651]|nr:hypothetical protein F5Y19DRAFT_324670 [Xylariaceae sp. FL1651]